MRGWTMGDNISIAEDNTYTLNSLRNTLHCNRRTAEKYIAKGNYKKTVKSYNGTEFAAWIISENEIKRLKSNLSYIQGGCAIPREMSTTKGNRSVDNITPVTDNITSELLRNVTELNGRITVLENENRGLQKEVKELTSENTVLVRDKATIESKMLLIEDKSKTIEGAWAEQKQRAEALEKTVKERNIQLLVTGAVLLTVVVVIACYFTFGS